MHMVYVRIALLLLMVSSRPAFAQSVVLTSGDIEEAIEIGVAREPRPYIIPHAPVREGLGTWGFRQTLWGDAFGLVFTPFLRVQFLSRWAWTTAEHRLTPAEIPPAVLAPVIHIAVWGAVHPPCRPHPPKLEVYPKDRGPLRVDPIHGPVGGPPGVEPLWTTDKLAVLEQYRAVSLLESDTATPLGIEDVSMVVAYSAKFLRSDVDFVETQGTSVPGPCVRKGRIPEHELASWR